MRKAIYFIILVAGLFMAACGGKKEESQPAQGHATKDLMLKDDKTIYGLACDGCNDSVVWLLPSNGDPVKYDVIDATRNHKVIGKIRVGDWIGIVRNPEDSTVADVVIDLDQLKGSWCYIVMPKLRDWENLSKRQQSRIERDMPDSVKEQYLIPREYGFTMKRQFQASSIGYVPDASSLEDESPVVYPKMAYYFAWHILNGKLILNRYASDPPLEARINGKVDKNVKMPEVCIDTINIDFLSDDSLVLSSDGVSRSYYRISKASEANKLARDKARARAKDALKSVTETAKPDESHDHAKEKK